MGIPGPQEGASNRPPPRRGTLVHTRGACRWRRPGNALSSAPRPATAHSADCHRANPFAFWDPTCLSLCRAPALPRSRVRPGEPAAFGRLASDAPSGGWLRDQTYSCTRAVHTAEDFWVSDAIQALLSAPCTLEQQQQTVAVCSMFLLPSFPQVGQVDPSIVSNGLGVGHHPIPSETWAEAVPAHHSALHYPQVARKRHLQSSIVSA